MASQIQIKVEEEDTNGLQSYLASFNEEIETGTATSTCIVSEKNGSREIEVEEEEEGTYFVDQAGNYYYQASKNSESILAVASDELIDDKGTIGEIDENIKEPIAQIKKTKSNDDEVSYLLIVDDNSKQDDGRTDEGETENVYEYEPGEETIKIEQEAERQQQQQPQLIKSGTRKYRRRIQTSKSNDDELSTNVHMCGYCDYSSPKRYLLARHLKSHSEDRPFKCSICERGFKTQASLQNHVNTHTGIKPHQCTYCFSSFTTSGELVRHVRYRHTHEKPHKCTECDYASVELSKLKRHIRCHTGERPYQCPHCTYASPDTFKLKRHLRIHTGEKPYECDICHARFTQSNSLKAHKLIHSVGDKPVFQCELCPTTCGRKTDLRIHVQKLHTSDQPLKCRRCNQLFPDRYTYKLHSKTHEGEKCFKCELCPYASISARHLESHMLIHTDQKPFECDVCNQSFRQKQLLKRHYNLYHNKNYIPPTPKPKTHVCPDCEKSFSHKGNLIRHMAIHDPDSGAKEEAFALKVGRQKKIHVFGNDAIEIIPNDGDDLENHEYITENDIIEKDEIEDDDGNGDMITIKEENDHDQQIVTLQTDNSDQYVVLEVIQIEGGENPNQIDEIRNDDDNQVTENDYMFSGKFYAYSQLFFKFHQ